MARLQSPTACALAAALLLAGCASFSPDGGFNAVEQTAKERLDKQLVWARSPEQQQRIDTRVAELLKRPLSADDAVQLALLNNKGLQAQYFELGIGEADLVQSGRMPNPGFSFARLTRGSEVELERSFHVNLARLIAMPAVQRVEAQRCAHTQGAVASSVLTLAADTRKAWIQAVAAEQSLRYSTQVMQAAEASAELARRMAEVGNFSKLQRAREQAFYAAGPLRRARAPPA